MSEKKIDEKEWLKAEIELCMEKYVESTKEIESLQARIEELEAENEVLREQNFIMNRESCTVFEDGSTLIQDTPAPKEGE